MTDIITMWLSSIIDNAPYLAGAAVAMWAMWNELKKCHEGNERIAQQLLDHIIEQRLNKL